MGFAQGFGVGAGAMNAGMNTGMRQQKLFNDLQQQKLEWGMTQMDVLNNAAKNIKSLTEADPTGKLAGSWLNMFGQAGAKIGLDTSALQPVLQTGIQSAQQQEKRQDFDALQANRMKEWEIAQRTSSQIVPAVTPDNLQDITTTPTGQFQRPAPVVSQPLYDYQRGLIVDPVSGEAKRPTGVPAPAPEPTPLVRGPGGELYERAPTGELTPARIKGGPSKNSPNYEQWVVNNIALGNTEVLSSLPPQEQEVALTRAKEQIKQAIRSTVDAEIAEQRKPGGKLAVMRPDAPMMPKLTDARKKEIAANVVKQTKGMVSEQEAMAEIEATESSMALTGNIRLKPTRQEVVDMESAVSDAVWARMFGGNPKKPEYQSSEIDPYGPQMPPNRLGPSIPMPSMR